MKNKNNISFILQDDTLVVSTSKNVYHLSVHDSRFKQVKEFIKNRESDNIDKILTEEFKEKEIFKKLSDMKCYIENDCLIYDGEPVNNKLASRIKDYINADLPVEPFVLFMNNLMENPSRNSVEQLYSFLENKNLPITEDGCFLAYKAVKNNYTDKHTGTILNSIGSTISMPRNKVDDNPANHCSYGFHCGALEYVNNFAYNGDHKLIVKVNPKNVVSVPNDHNCQKIRICEYYIVSHFEGKPLSSVYSDSFEHSFEDDLMKSDETYMDSIDLDAEWEDFAESIYKDGKLWEKPKEEKTWIKKANPFESKPTFVRSQIDNPQEHDKIVKAWKSKTEKNKKHPKRDKYGRFISSKR